MSYNRFAETDFIFVFKKGLSANVHTQATAYQAMQGEPHYCTDTEKLYIFNGTANRLVHGLDRALVHNSEIITNNGEITWLP